MSVDVGTEWFKVAVVSVRLLIFKIEYSRPLMSFLEFCGCANDCHFHSLECQWRLH